jgi:hypothetical protein
MGACIAAIISAVTAGLWLGIIILLHFVKPELDPRTRMISEYARRTPSGEQSPRRHGQQAAEL